MRHHKLGVNSLVLGALLMMSSFESGMGREASGEGRYHWHAAGNNVMPGAAHLA